MIVIALAVALVPATIIAVTVVLAVAVRRYEVG